MLKKTLTILASASFVASPALAQNPASALSLQPSAVRAGADVDEGNDLVGGGIAPILFVAIIVAGVLTATGTIFDDGDNSPTSP